MKHKRYIIDRRRTGNYNLIIVGCGFVILIYLACFMLCYEKHIELPGPNYAELANRYEILDEPFVYDFMNQIIQSKSSSDSLEFIKLKCFVLPHSKNSIKNLIYSINDSILSRADKWNLIDNLSDEWLLWNKNKLKKIWVLSPLELDKLDESRHDDFWINFKKFYGKYGLHSYSKPLFNEDKTVAIIEHAGSGDWLLGSGDIYVFIKYQGKWILYDSKMLWIS